MNTELIVALIAGGISLITLAGTIWSSVQSNQNTKAIAQISIDNDNRQNAEKRRRETTKFSEPLARSAYDLQSRLYNILAQEFLTEYLTNGNDREKTYAVNNTTFLIAQYFCWSEQFRHEVQSQDLGYSDKTLDLLRRQDDIYSAWGTDRYPATVRVFAGEQRAIGEALVQINAAGSGCMGYGAFLKELIPGANTLVDALRDDIASLAPQLSEAKERLRLIQNLLVDLLAALDPDSIRFPAERRSKI